MLLRGSPAASPRSVRRGRQPGILIYNSNEANGLWRSLAGARKSTQARAAHAHGSSADILSQSPAAGSVAAAASGAPQLFSYLGLGSRNSDTFLEPSHAAADGGGSAAAARSAGGAATALLLRLQSGLRRIGSSLEELAYDGAAESMPGWDASRMCGVLMVAALLRRRPDEAWLREFWSVSAAKLPDCGAADLAMLSFGLSELELRPPHAWGEALLAAALRLAEAPAEADADVAAAAEPAAAAAAHSTGAPAGAGLAGVLRVFAPATARASHPPVPGAGAGAPGAASTGTGSGSGSGEEAAVGPAAGADAPGLASLSPELWLPSRSPATAGAASAGSRAAAAGAPAADAAGTAPATAAPLAAPPPPLNSAYDMEDLYGGAPPESASGMAALLLEPLRGLWRGVRGAAAAVTSSWQRGRAASDLVTVLYNATGAGLSVDADWLGRFLEAMRSRLVFLSGDDLSCLLSVAVEEGCGGGRGGCLLEPSREWQAALFARMDGINWSLQSRHLVECLRAITTLGLRPPRPWLRRQLLALQPSLPLLPNASLAQLVTLLPPLLAQPPALAAAAAAAATADADVASAAAPAAAAGAAAAVASGDGDVRWLASFLADLRAVAAERRDTMTPAELLSVLRGVTAVTSAGQSSPSSSAAATAAGEELTAASALRLRSVALSYAEWRRCMVAAVAARIPDSSLAGLCEAWQVLAEAEAGARQGGGGGGAAAADVAAGAGGAASGAAEELSELRTLVADGLATHHAQQLTASDVAPVLSSLAAAGVPLPPAVLDALLACAQPLLAGLTCAELVTVSLSLARLAHKPNIAWQAAFCAACRRRLGLMTPQQRCSLLVASASLGLHLPDPWVRDFFAVSERGGGGGSGAGGGGDEAVLGAPQLANLLWAVSCVAPEPPASWLQRWEAASLPRLRELGPNMLAVVLKAMCTLHYRPSLAWQSAYFAALQRRLFAAGAAHLRWPQPDAAAAAAAATAPLEGQQPPEEAAQSQAVGPAAAAAAAAAGTSMLPELGPSSAPPTPTASQPQPPQPPGTDAAPTWTAAGGVDGSVRAPPAASRSSRPAPGSAEEAAATAAAAGGGYGGYGDAPGGGVPAGGMLSATVTTEALNSVVHSLATLNLEPPAAWMDELMDAVRCKLSLLSTLDMSVVLAYLVERKHRPHDEWWESFLEAFEGRFGGLSAGELTSLLVMLNALKVSPSAHWLDAFCAATEPRLGLFQPPQLLQVLSCLHLFRHRPGQSWMAAFAAAVEANLPRFFPTELARVLMLLDHLNQRPGPAFMERFFDNSRPGLSQLETQELVNVAWAVVSCSVMQPDVRWVEALVEAARPRVSSLQQHHLRVLVAALGHMQRGAPCPAAGDFLALAREFLVV